MDPSGTGVIEGGGGGGGGLCSNRDHTPPLFVLPDCPLLPHPVINKVT